MFYYLVYFLDYKKLNKNLLDEITCKAIFNSRKAATGFLSEYAIDYVREYQGKQQTEICIQYDKTPEQILSDQKLKEGYYLGKKDDSIILYEKTQIKIPGTIWNSYELKINKIGMFNIAEIQSNSDNFVTASCQQVPVDAPHGDARNNNNEILNSPLLSSNTIKTMRKSQQTYTFLDELKKIFMSTNGCKLKSMNNNDNMGTNKISICENNN